MIVTTSVKYWLNHICSLVTYTALVQHFLWWLALGLIVTHSVCSLGRANQGALMKAATNQQQKLTLAVTSCAFIIIIISEWLIEEYSGPWSEKSTEIKPQRAFFLLFARTMVIQQVFQHQYDAATPQTHSTKWYRNIRFQTNDKARAPTTAMLIWAVIHVVITVTSTPL